MTSSRPLFDLGPASPAPAPPERTTKAADALIVRPQRTQVRSLPTSLDDHVPAQHPVRALWDVIAALDLSSLEARVESNRRQGGRPASDPHVLMALWVYATSEGEGRASEIARRAQTDDIYRWLRGEVPAAERKLAAFRAANLDAFSALLTQVIAVLMYEDLVDVSRIAQDGTRVRASAGTGSFKRLPTLDAALDAARAHVTAVFDAALDPTQRTVAETAALRGARERQERIERARERVLQITATRALLPEVHEDKKKAPRASITDPDATVMKMGDGGFRPAYNVQFATAADASGVVLGVAVTRRGSDQGELGAMRAQVEQRTGEAVNEQLADAGYVQHEEIEQAAAGHTQITAPLPTRRAKAGGEREKKHTAGVKQWQAHMESEQGQASFRDRGRSAELTNARAKTEGSLGKLLVRGAKAVLTCAVLAGLTINVERLISLRDAREPATTASMPST